MILDLLSEHQVVAIPSQSPKWTQPRVLPTFDKQLRQQILEHDIEQCTETQSRWDKVEHDAIVAESLVEPARRNYYQAGVLTMIVINSESNRMLLNVAQSIKDYNACNDRKAEAEEAQAALHSLNLIQQSMSKAEYGK